MRRWMAAPLVFAAAAALALTGEAPRALAQPAPPAEETITTADGVKLRGLFHRTAKPQGGDPVVVLLYQPGVGKDMTKGDWDGLAKRLNDEGFHVFRFDWRGHGRSTDISVPSDNTDPLGFSGFWTNRMTGDINRRHIRGGGKKGTSNTLSVKDIDAKYFPVYANDLAAVRAHLDQKNDQGELNTSSIYLIGAEDTAALGFLWMRAEWARPAVHPTLGGGLTYKVVPMQGILANPEAGADIAGAVWLSASRPAAIAPQTIRTWAKDTPKIRDNNPMLFLYGDKDGAATTNADFYFDEVLVAKGNNALKVKKLDQTFMTPVAGAKTLRGVALLGQDDTLKTETTIMKYLAARQKDRVAITRKQRQYNGPYYIDLGYFGLRP